MMSFREQSQVERMFRSSARWRRAEEADAVAEQNKNADFVIASASGNDALSVLEPLDQNARAEQHHDHAARTLEQCGLGFPLGAAPENVETEAVDQRIPEHVQRIGKSAVELASKPAVASTTNIAALMLKTETRTLWFRSRSNLISPALA